MNFVQVLKVWQCSTFSTFYDILMALQLIYVRRYFLVSNIPMVHSIPGVLFQQSFNKSSWSFGLSWSRLRKFIFDLLIVRAQMLSFEAIENIEADKVVELFPGGRSGERSGCTTLY